MTYKLKIKAKTWSKDSYDLFDYEASEFQATEFSANKSGLMIRKGTQLKFLPESPFEQVLTGNELLFSIREQGG